MLIAQLKAALLATAIGAAALINPAQASSVSGQPPVPSSRPWLVGSPADVKATTAIGNQQSELAALKAITKKRTAQDIARNQWWSTGGPVYRWNEIVLDEIQESFVVLPMAARHLALFHVALDDAVAAARDQSKQKAATAPTTVDSALDPKRTPSGPSQHAAAAAAAAEVLAYLFPAKAAQFSARAEEAMQSRVLAGVSYPGEVAAGREIGKKVAALAIARGKADGSDVKWTGTIPEGPGKWKGTNPIMPQAAHWVPWVLTSPSELRPAAPPAFDSEQVKAALAELKTFQRTPKLNHRANYWEVHGGARAHTLWNDLARARIIEEGYAPEAAARVLSALNIAMADAGIACWDAKFAFWYIRPPQLDPELKSLFPPPNHPSFPAAHGCFSTAAATVLASAFPRDKERLLGLGKEAAEARVWAGIHYRFDIDAGQEIGRKAGERALERAFQTASR
jgi:membrane-associated phospholipid phosphatase